MFVDIPCWLGVNLVIGELHVMAIVYIYEQVFWDHGFYPIKVYQLTHMLQ